MPEENSEPTQTKAEDFDQPPTNPAPSRNRAITKAGLTIAGLLILILLLTISYFLYSKRQSNQPQNQSSSQSPQPSNNSGQPGAVVSEPNTNPDVVTLNSPILTVPTLQKAKPSNYAFFIVRPDFPDINNTTYLEDGFVPSGPYAGYHLIRVTLNDGPGYDETDFATKDYKTFVVDQSQSESYNREDIYNKTVVTGLADLSSAQPPKTLTVGSYTLKLQFIYPDVVKLGPSLSAHTGSLELFGDQSSADVTAVDKYGVSFKYLFPSELKKSDFTTSTATYDDYAGFQNGCGSYSSTVLSNIQLPDLKQVTKTQNGVNIYTFADQNNPLIQQEYKNRITDGVDNQWFNDYNPGKTVPTYQEFVAKNPILIFQDPFGRWVATAQIDYPAPGECGKPVIYLYPPSPTKVRIQLEQPVRFTGDIPTYSSGWSILAYPSGQLKDLQPQATDCASINSKTFGLEYAADACKKGIYPYLFWSGQTNSRYPTEQKGWIVSREDLKAFMNNILDSIGFTTQEKTDMVSYWVPEMFSKDAPYYRISFFQTSQMNQFIPMKVTPTPESVYRLFLDWAPLTQKPNFSLKPEVLDHVNRKGFTLIEWGGLKQ